MHTHRFGKKITLPATIAIKHQLRKLMLEDLIKEEEKAEVIARTEATAGGSAFSKKAPDRRALAGIAFDVV
jgi:hypothetical protein